MLGLITSFIPGKLISALILGGVVVSIAYLGFNHYSNMVDEIKALNASKARLEMAVNVQTETIRAKDEAIDKWALAQDELVATIESMAQMSADAAEEKRKMDDIFAKHNLTNLSKRKPGLIEKRINRGSAAADRMLYCASGGTGPGCSK